MNIDDLLCVGALDNILLSSTIGRNKNLIPGEVLAALINGTEEVCKMLRDNGVNIVSTGKKMKMVEPLLWRCVHVLPGVPAGTVPIRHSNALYLTSCCVSCISMRFSATDVWDVCTSAQGWACSAAC